MSDRIVVMNNGVVEQDGTPEELYLHPINRFVAEFIGDTNLLTGVYRGTENNKAVLEWGGQTVGAYAGAALAGAAHAGAVQPAPGSEVTASIRLENLKCQATRPEVENTVQAQIVTTVFKGSRKAITVSVGAMGTTLLTAYVDAGISTGAAGDSVWIGWDSKHLSLLR